MYIVMYLGMYIGMYKGVRRCVLRYTHVHRCVLRNSTSYVPAYVHKKRSKADLRCNQSCTRHPVFTGFLSIPICGVTNHAHDTRSLPGVVSICGVTNQTVLFAV